MERFFWSLKQAWPHQHEYQDLDDARWSVFQDIESLYKTVRIHDTFGRISFNQHEAKPASVTAAYPTHPPESATLGPAHRGIPVFFVINLQHVLYLFIDTGIAGGMPPFFIPRVMRVGFG